MGAEQATAWPAYSCGIRFEESVDQYKIKFTYNSKEAAHSLLARGGTNLLEVGNIFRWGSARGCK
jgi:hypothetical protein